MSTSVEGGALGALRANLWPAGRAGGLKLRLSVIFAMSLVSASLAAGAPLFLRRLVGALSGPALIAAPALLVVAYPVLRFLGLATIQARVVLTAAVMEGVKGRFAADAFAHVLALGRVSTWTAARARSPGCWSGARRGW